MPQPIVIPQGAVPYRGGLTQSAPVSMMREPREGKCVPLAINWAAGEGGKNANVFIDLQTQGPQSIGSMSQVCCLYVDNSASANTVVFVFPDTGFLLEVPPDSTGYYPVLTNGLQLYVFQNLVSAGDKTNVFVMNFMVPEANVLQQVPINVTIANIPTVGTINEILKLDTIVNPLPPIVIGAHQWGFNGVAPVVSTIFLPAANINGARITNAWIQNAAANFSMLITGAVAPVANQDFAKPNVLAALEAQLVKVLPYPMLLPAGFGLWWCQVSGNSNTMGNWDFL